MKHVFRLEMSNGLALNTEYFQVFLATVFSAQIDTLVLGRQLGRVT